MRKESVHRRWGGGQAALLALTVALAGAIAACGGGGGSSSPTSGLSSLPVMGGSSSQTPPPTVAALIAQLGGLALSGNVAPELQQLVGALPAGGTLCTVPVIGAVEGTTGGGLTNLPLTNPTVSIPDLGALLPPGGACASIGTVPVLGTVVEGGTSMLCAALPVLAPPAIPGANPRLLGVLAVACGGPITPAQLLALAQALQPGGAGLNLAPILGAFAGTPPPSFLAGLPTSTLAGLLTQLLGLIV